VRCIFGKIEPECLLDLLMVLRLGKNKAFLAASRHGLVSGSDQTTSSGLVSAMRRIIGWFPQVCHGLSFWLK
jgi:hypothetical protein